MKNNHHCERHLNDNFNAAFEKMSKTRYNRKFTNENFEEKPRRVIYDTESFKCLQCGNFVSADRERSGVNNRNHCPCCLWSRHVDRFTPGDRRSDCGSRMEPIGLTLKQNLKKYGNERQGELMLIHRCAGCDKYSINRIAADDNTLKVYDLYQKSGGNTELKDFLENQGILMLTPRDLTTVHAQLFGKQSLSDEFTAKDIFIKSEANFAEDQNT